jgi:hypothetical protein
MYLQPTYGNRQTALSERVPPDWQMIVFNTWTEIWRGAPGGLNMKTERLSDRQYLRDFEFSSLFLYHVWTFIYFLWHFRPFLGHGFHVFLPPVAPMSLRCEPVFFSVFSSMTTSLITSSSHPFPGLPVGFLPPEVLPQFVFGFSCLTSFLYAQPTLVFLHACMSPGQWVHIVFVVSCSP